VWKENLAKTAADKKISIHEVVTVASIIETEAKLDSERPVVASVVYNRMSKSMPLGVDSTVVYAAKIDGKWHNNGKVYQSDIDRRSPYNTRIFKGLPPGPVGSPGLSSLLAALNPAQTTYLFYVRNPYQNNGAHNFYSSAAEFENGVTMLRNWEKKQAPAAAAVQTSAPAATMPPAPTPSASSAGSRGILLHVWAKSDAQLRLKSTACTGPKPPSRFSNKSQSLRQNRQHLQNRLSKLNRPLRKRRARQARRLVLPK